MGKSEKAFNFKFPKKERKPNSMDDFYENLDLNELCKNNLEQQASYKYLNE